MEACMGADGAMEGKSCHVDVRSRQTLLSATGSPRSWRPVSLRQTSRGSRLPRRCAISCRYKGKHRRHLRRRTARRARLRGADRGSDWPAYRDAGSDARIAISAPNRDCPRRSRLSLCRRRRLQRAKGFHVRVARSVLGDRSRCRRPGRDLLSPVCSIISDVAPPVRLSGRPH